MEKPVRLSTEDGKSYWNSNGAYQKEFDELYDKLVPAQGEADTVHGEMLRAASRLFYDFCNNGNCNVIDVKTETETEYTTCHNCNGSGEVYTDDDEEESETCPECRGSGEIEEEVEVDGEIEIDGYYQKMIDVIEENLINKKPLQKLIDFLMDKSRGYSRYKFNNEEMRIYNDLTDEIVYQVLTTENKKRKVTDK